MSEYLDWMPVGMIIVAMIGAACGAAAMLFFPGHDVHRHYMEGVAHGLRQAGYICWTRADGPDLTALSDAAMEIDRRATIAELDASAGPCLDDDDMPALSGHGGPSEPGRMVVVPSEPWWIHRPQASAAATAQEGSGHRGVTLNGRQLREAMEFIDSDDECDVGIAWLPDRTSSEGEAMPAGYYAWMADYPEEGCIPLTATDEAIPGLAHG
jgi:hypothetical protein